MNLLGSGVISGNMYGVLLLLFFILVSYRYSSSQFLRAGNQHNVKLICLICVICLFNTLNKVRFCCHDVKIEAGSAANCKGVNSCSEWEHFRFFI